MATIHNVRPAGPVSIGCSADGVNTPLTAPAVVRCLSPLGAALRDYNAAFKATLALPIWPEAVDLAAEIAELRGRKDIALKLRLALNLEGLC